MSQDSEQTAGRDRSATLAFRTSEEHKHLVQAIASRKGCLPSDWLRDLLNEGLRRELGRNDAADWDPGDSSIREAERRGLNGVRDEAENDSP